jgi:hypothetical protein
MKRIVKLTLVLVSIIVLLAAALPGSAQTARTDFTQIEYDCLTDPKITWPAMAARQCPAYSRYPPHQLRLLGQSAVDRR